MRISKIIAGASTLALAGGLAGGLSGGATAQAATGYHHPAGISAETRVSGPVGGWATERFTRDATLLLVSAVVTPAVPAVAADPTATPPVTASPAVPAYTTYTYTARLRDSGSFRAIPWALTPNQSGWYYGQKIRGAVSGDLEGYASFGTFSSTVPANPALVPGHLTTATLAATWPALFFPAGTALKGLAESSYSTSYSASGLRWSFIPGYWRTLVKGHWAHFKATKHHKAYSKWIPAKRVYVQGRWVSHEVTQRWTCASWNNAGQSYRAGNISGFFGVDWR